nr:hypothetical protein HK105_005967 [Polyrhizophydium stewartii]
MAIGMSNGATFSRERTSSTGSSVMKHAASFYRRMSMSKAVTPSYGSSLNMGESANSLLLHSTITESSTVGNSVSGNIEDKTSGRVKSDLVDFMNLVCESADGLALLSGFLPFKFKSSAYAQHIQNDSRHMEICNFMIRVFNKITVDMKIPEFENQTIASHMADICQKDEVKHLVLPPLNRDMVRKMILNQLASDRIQSIDENLIQAIHTHTHGNCFLVQLIGSKIAEITHELVAVAGRKDRGGVALPDDDQDAVLHLVLDGETRIVWSGNDDIASLVGGGLRAVIASQLDQLSDSYQLVLFVSAVLGQHIDLDMLAEIVPRCAEIIGTSTALPVGKGDTHVLIQETIYSMILPEQREAIHTVIAEYLEQLLTIDTRGEILPVLVHHLSNASSLVDKYAVHLEQLFNFHSETGSVSEGVRTYELLNDLEDSRKMGLKHFARNQITREMVLQYAHQGKSIYGKRFLYSKSGGVFMDCESDSIEIEILRRIVGALERLAQDEYIEGHLDSAWIDQSLAERILPSDREIFLGRMAWAHICRCEFVEAGRALSKVVKSMELKSILGTHYGFQVMLVHIRLCEIMGDLREALHLSKTMIDASGLQSQKSTWTLLGMNAWTSVKFVRLEIDDEVISSGMRALSIRDMIKSLPTSARLSLRFNFIRCIAIAILINTAEAHVAMLSNLEELVGQTPAVIETLTSGQAASFRMPMVWFSAWDAMLFVIELAERKQDERLIQLSRAVLVAVQSRLNLVKNPLQRLLRSLLQAQVAALSNRHADCVRGIAKILRTNKSLSQSGWGNIRFRIHVALAMACKRQQPPQKPDIPKKLVVSSIDISSGYSGSQTSGSGKRVAPLEQSEDSLRFARRYIQETDLRAYELLLDRPPA